MTSLSRRRHRVITAILASLVGVATPAISCAIIAEEGFGWTSFSCAMLGLAAWLALVIRAVRLRVDAGEHGIVVANFWRTTSIAWTDLAALKVGPASLSWQHQNAFNVTLIAQRRDGRTIRASALGRDESEVDLLVAELAPLTSLANTHGVAFEAPPIDPAERAKIVRAAKVLSGLARGARWVR